MTTVGSETIHESVERECPRVHEGNWWAGEWRNTDICVDSYPDAIRDWQQLKCNTTSKICVIHIKSSRHTVQRDNWFCHFVEWYWIWETRKSERIRSRYRGLSVARGIQLVFNIVLNAEDRSVVPSKRNWIQSLPSDLASEVGPQTKTKTTTISGDKQQTETTIWRSRHQHERQQNAVDGRQNSEMFGLHANVWISTMIQSVKSYVRD